MGAMNSVFGDGAAPGTEVSPIMSGGKSQSLQSVLGLGDGEALNSQVEAEILERRKRALLVANQPPSAFGAVGFGTGTNVGAGVAVNSPMFSALGMNGMLGQVRG